MSRDSGIYSGEAMTEEWLIKESGNALPISITKDQKTAQKVSLQEIRTDSEQSKFNLVTPKYS